MVMSQGSGQRVWHRDEQSGQLYFYDTRSDTLVYQDNHRVARPINVPRSFYLSPPAESRSQTLPHSENPGSSSHPAQNYQYGLSSSTSPRTADPSQRMPRQQLHTSGQSGPQKSSSSFQSSPNAVANNLNSLSLDSMPPLREPPKPYLPTRVCGRWTEQSGIQILTVTDKVNGVSTIMGVAPPEQITEPGILPTGIRAHKALYGTNEAEERLFSSFKQRSSTFFVLGRVFMILWSEPAGAATVVTNYERNDRSIATNSDNKALSTVRFGEQVYSKVRRFVVIRDGINYCSALPIVSYGKQGVGKASVVKSEHAIIYTGREIPKILPAERPGPGEEGLRPRPIRVVPDNDTDKLDPESRVDFGKVHTIQHNLKTKAFGMVAENDREAFTTQFGNVWKKLLGSVDTTSTGISRSSQSSRPTSTAQLRAQQGNGQSSNLNQNSGQFLQANAVRPVNQPNQQRQSAGQVGGRVGLSNSHQARVTPSTRSRQDAQRDSNANVVVSQNEDEYDEDYVDEPGELDRDEEEQRKTTSSAPSSRSRRQSTSTRSSASQTNNATNLEALNQWIRQLYDHNRRRGFNEQVAKENVIGHFIETYHCSREHAVAFVIRQLP